MTTKNIANLKKYLEKILLLFLLSYQVAFANIQKLKVEYQEKIDKDNYIKIIPELIIDSDISLPGDSFLALLTKPSAEILGLPLGSKIYGTINKIIPEANFYRSAKIYASIDHLILPNGKIIKASMQLSSSSALKSRFKVKKINNLGTNVAKYGSNVVLSSAVGLVDAVQYAGLGTAIASHGISAAVGAVLGLGLALADPVKNKGQKYYGDNYYPLNFKIEKALEIFENFDLSADDIPQNTERFGIVSAQIKNYKNFGRTLLIDLELEKEKSKTFALSSDSLVKPIYPNLLLSSVDNARQILRLAFALNDSKLDPSVQLVTLDPLSDKILSCMNLSSILELQ